MGIGDQVKRIIAILIFATESPQIERRGHSVTRWTPGLGNAETLIVNESRGSFVRRAGRYDMRPAKIAVTKFVGF